MEYSVYVCLAVMGGAWAEGSEQAVLLIKTREEIEGQGMGT